VAAIRHLPERERALADCELAVLDYHDRQLPRLARVRRWATGVRVASGLLGFVLLWLGLDWSGIAVMTAVIVASYGVEADQRVCRGLVHLACLCRVGQDAVLVVREL
jgi:hypothetical protein